MEMVVVENLEVGILNTALASKMGTRLAATAQRN